MVVTSSCSSFSVWRWRTVFAKFVVSFLAFGIYKSFGVLLPYLVRGLGTNFISIGWGFGLYGGLVYLLGPLAGALTRLYGARRVVIVGGVMAAVGLSFSALATSPFQLGLAFTCSGFGHGLSLLPSVEPIAFYFPTGFALANGVALSGASIGMMVLPPASEKFVDLYGWRGTLMILGALEFHIIFAAMLMGIPESEQSFAHMQKHRDENAHAQKHREGNLKKKEKRVQCDTNASAKTDKYDRLDGSDDQENSCEEEEGFEKRLHRYRRQRAVETNSRRQDEERKLFTVAWMSKNFKGNRTRHHSTKDQEDTTALLDSHDEPNTKDNTINNEQESEYEATSFKELLIESFDMKLFGQEPLIIFIDVVIFFFALTYGAWTVYLVPHAIARGVNSKDAAFLSTMAGFTNFFGRILYAPVIDKDLLDPRTFFGIISFIMSVLFVIDPLFESYVLMSLSAAIAGLVVGAGNSMWTILIKQFVDECGSGTFVSTLGWACLFSGAGCMISSPLAGWFFDKLDDYELVFQMMGAVSAVVVVILCAVKITQTHVS